MYCLSMPFSTPIDKPAPFPFHPDWCASVPIRQAATTTQLAFMLRPKSWVLLSAHTVTALSWINLRHGITWVNTWHWVVQKRCWYLWAIQAWSKHTLCSKDVRHKSKNTHECKGVKTDRDSPEGDSYVEDGLKNLGNTLVKHIFLYINASENWN